MKSRIIRFLVSSALVGAVASAGAVTVTPEWQIVVPDPEDSGVSGALRAAADRLSRAFAENSGKRLPVVTRAKMKKGPAIHFGAAEAERAGLLRDAVVDFANVVAEKGGDIYLFGRDRSGRPGKKGADWRRCILPTVRALTRFMEANMDVRFLCPGEIGTDIPKGAAVTLTDGTYDLEKPALDYSWANVDDPLHSYANGLFGAGRYHSYGGHSYPVACPASKLFKDHPEYFGLIKGKRAVSHHGDGQTALCLSNPAVRKLILEEALRRFDEGADIVQVAQQDGCAVCSCEDCAKFMKTSAWNEKYWRFHLLIARAVQKLRPGKIVWIPAYGATAKPPEGVAFPDNVLIEQATSTDEAFASYRKAGYRGDFTAYIYLWGCYPALGACPKRSFATCARLARLLRRNNVRGVYRCGYGELYGMEGPAYYVFNRVMLDPTRRTDELVKEYCTRMYGPGAARMLEFFRQQDARLTAVNLFDGSDRTNDEGEFFEPMTRHVSFRKTPMDVFAFAYGAETLRQMELCLLDAERAARTEKQKARLQLVRSEFEYVKALAAVAQTQAAYLAAPSEDAARICAGAYARQAKVVGDILACADHTGQTDYRFPAWRDVRYYGWWPHEQVANGGRSAGDCGLQMLWMRKYLANDGLLPGAWDGFGDRMTDLAPKDAASEQVFSNTDAVRSETAVALPALPTFEPGRKYRLSLLAKIDNVRPVVPHGGFHLFAQCGRTRSELPKGWDRRMVGRSGWIPLTFDFVAEKGATPRLFAKFHNSQGTARLADIVCAPQP